MILRRRCWALISLLFEWRLILPFPVHSFLCSCCASQRMIVANPFTTIIPKIPVHLPPIDPAAEDGPLWSALSAAMPQLKPVPELEEQWKRARREKRKQLRLEKEAEILHWGGYIKEKPKKEKKKKEQQTEQQAEQTEQQNEQQKQ